MLSVASLLTALLLSVCARHLVGDLLARNFVLGEYKPGDRIRVGEVDGEVEAVGTTAVRIRNHDGSYLVPNARLLQEIILRKRPPESADQPVK